MRNRGDPIHSVNTKSGETALKAFSFVHIQKQGTRKSNHQDPHIRATCPLGAPRNSRQLRLQSLSPRYSTWSRFHRFGFGCPSHPAEGHHDGSFQNVNTDIHDPGEIFSHFRRTLFQMPPPPSFRKPPAPPVHARSKKASSASRVQSLEKTSSFSIHQGTSSSMQINA